MKNLNDLVYALFLTGSYHEKEMIKILYEKDKENFKKYVSYIFHIDFQKTIYKWIGLKFKSKYSQKEYNDIFYDLSLFYHKYRDESYLLKRDITKEQIERWKLGSTHAVLDKEKFEPFKEDLYKKYNKDLVKLILEYHQMIFKVNLNMYGYPHCATIPSFSNNGEGRGVCYRTISYKKKISFKNLYKFQFSHGPSYCFGEQVLDKYNHFYVVEGVFDKLALERIGVENVIALGNNTFSKYQDLKLRKKKLIFILDNDKGGLFGLRRLRKFVERKNSNIIKLTVPPEKGLDVDDLILKDSGKMKNFINDLEEIWI